MTIRPLTASVVSVCALLVSGCSADTALFRADWNWWSSSTGSVPPPRSAAPEDLVGPEGTCPGEAAQAAAARGVALGMTECDLVRLAGPGGTTEIAANERGERTASITYVQGERAGIYRFRSGVLTSIERAPETGKPKPAAKKKPKAKPKPKPAAPA